MSMTGIFTKEKQELVLNNFNTNSVIHLYESSWLDVLTKLICTLKLIYTCICTLKLIYMYMYIKTKMCKMREL